MRVRARIGWAAAVMAASTAGGAALVATAGGPHDGPLADIRSATTRFTDVDRAIDAGYVQFFGCVHEPLMGSMGTHFVNATLVGDTFLDPHTPEVLTYSTGSDGEYELAGVEYVVFQEAWDAEHDAPPSMFGQTFTLVEEPNRYGIPAFYELHAWPWQQNPSGDFADWNPTILCEDTEGHVR